MFQSCRNGLADSGQMLLLPTPVLAHELHAQHASRVCDNYFQSRPLLNVTNGRGRIFGCGGVGKKPEGKRLTRESGMYVRDETRKAM